MRPTSIRRRAQAGFTLIELMVAMVVSAIVVLGVYAFSSIQQSTATLHERNVRVQQALEGAMWTIAQDVRMSGLGFARACTELRVYDAGSGQLINPGAVADPGLASTDVVTGDPFWVLRDGLQAKWNSSVGASLAGAEDRSSSPTSAADSFDVILADGAYVGTFGAFRLDESDPEGDAFLEIRSSGMINNIDHIAQVQQLFPPGTFIAISRTPGPALNPFLVDSQGQCPLLQITGDVLPDINDPQVWLLPIDGAISGFNSNLAALFDHGVVSDDWQDGVDADVGASIIPLGRLRWSRYEIDYTVPTLPYLVRYDIIGYRDGIDPGTLGAVDYPHCSAGECPAPQLHLPETGNPPGAVAVGPMIEDMQVAVGCDGYTSVAAAAAPVPIAEPDPGFEELGPAVGPMATQPNLQIDENPSGNDRDIDEWLGNARDEISTPDCVWYGTGQERAPQWVGVEGDSNPPPLFRMSPQSVRVTLVGSSETDEAAGGLADAQVLAVEDRPPLPSPVGIRQRFTLTEVFTPKNLRWRDPTVL